MDEIPLICGALVLIAAVVAAVLLIQNIRSYNIEKKKEGANTVLTITAKRNLARVSVLASFNGEEMLFERKRIRKGQSVDFSFPYSEKKIKVTVEGESGRAQAVEV